MDENMRNRRLLTDGPPAVFAMPRKQKAFSQLRTLMNRLDGVQVALPPGSPTRLPMGFHVSRHRRTEGRGNYIRR